jgi:hypothetical protein
MEHVIEIYDQTDTHVGTVNVSKEVSIEDIQEVKYALQEMRKNIPEWQSTDIETTAMGVLGRLGYTKADIKVSRVKF